LLQNINTTSASYFIHFVGKTKKYMTACGCCRPHPHIICSPHCNWWLL